MSTELSRLILEIDSKGVVKATGNLEIFKKKSQEAADSATNLDSVMHGLSPSALAAAAGVTALVSSFKGLMSSMKGTIDAYAHFEGMQKQLESFFHSADKGKAVFEDLRRLSNETTFGVDELANSASQLLNVGVASSDINDMLIQIGNIAQGDKMKFAELTSIMSKIQSTGKAGAMQLQQIQMRGIPIREELKRMGVQGTATADDIAKAFENLTSEINPTTNAAGQFYQAMENINDTIEGKEGFIADYWKEMKVNIADATGIADTYKKVLDILRESIGGISDLFLKASQNPIAKAILSGLMVGVLATLATVIGITLLQALKRVNKELAITAALKTFLHPTGAAAGIAAIAALGVAIGGITAGVMSWKNSQQSLNDTIDESNEKMKELKGTLANEGFSGLYKGFVKDISQKIKELEDEIAEKQAKINEAHSKIGMGLKKSDKNYDFQGAKSQLEKLEKQKAEYEETARLMKVIDSAQESIAERPLTNTEEIDRTQKQIEDLYGYIKDGDKLLSDHKKEVAELMGITDEAEINKLFKVDDNAKNEAYKTIDYLKNKLVDLKKASDEYKNSWQAVFEKTTGVSGTDKNGNKIESGEVLSETYLNNINENLNRQKQIAQMLTGNKNLGIEFDLSQLVSYRDEIKNAISQLMTAKDKNGKYLYSEDDEESMESISMLTSAMSLLDRQIDATTKEMKAFKENGLAGLDKAFSKLALAQDSFNEIGKSAISGTDAGSFVQYMEEGLDPLTALLLTVVGDFVELVASIDSVQECLNAVNLLVKPLVQVLTPLIDSVLKPIVEYLDLLGEAFASVISPISNALKVLIDIVMLALLPIKFILIAVGAAFQWLNDEVIVPCGNAVIDGINSFLSGINKFLESLGVKKQIALLDRLQTTEELLADEKDSELEKLKKLKDEITSLTEALEKQEEYYITSRTAIAAENLRSVHDMILTPQGNFSTDPKDYLIATKNPASLSSGCNVYVEVKNEAGDTTKASVSRTTDEDGNEHLMIQIRKMVASDFATGAYGWENAIAMRNANAYGRTVLG